MVSPRRPGRLGPLPRQVQLALAVLATLLPMAVPTVSASPAVSASQAATSQAATSQAVDPAPRFSVRLEPAEAHLYEEIELTLTITGLPRPGARVEPSFETENLQQLTGPEVVEDVPFSGLGTGETGSGDPASGASAQPGLRHRQRLTWRLRPWRVGPAATRRLRVTVDGRAYTLPDAEIRVLPPPASRVTLDPATEQAAEQALAPPAEPAPGRRGSDLELLAEISHPRPWAGQQVTYTAWLFTRGSVSHIQPLDLPTFPGAWVKEARPEGRTLPLQPVTRAGRVTWKTAVLRRLIFPAQPGRLAIGPTRLRMTVESGTKHEQETLPLALDVRPLPPAPEDFSGAVGRFQLTAELEPRVVRVGEAAILTLRLSGVGNLHGIARGSLLALTPPDELPRGGAGPEVQLEILPPELASEEAIEDLQLVSTRRWSYPVIPRRAGRWELPVATLRTFDPEAGLYRLLRTATLTLEAQELEAQSLEGQEATRRVELPEGGLAAPGLPSPEAGDATTGEAKDRTHDRLKMIALSLALLVLLVISNVWRTTRRWNDGGSRRDARIDLPRPVREAFRQAHQDPTPRQASRRLEAALRAALAETWNLPPDLPARRWAEALRATTQPDSQPAAQAASDLATHLADLRSAPHLASVDALLDSFEKAAEPHLRFLFRGRG